MGQEQLKTSESLHTSRNQMKINLYTRADPEECRVAFAKNRISYACTGKHRFLYNKANKTGYEKDTRREPANHWHCRPPDMSVCCLACRKTCSLSQSAGVPLPLLSCLHFHASGCFWARSKPTVRTRRERAVLITVSCYAEDFQNGLTANPARWKTAFGLSASFIVVGVFDLIPNVSWWRTCCGLKCVLHNKRYITH